MKKMMVVVGAFVCSLLGLAVVACDGPTDDGGLATASAALSGNVSANASRTSVTTRLCNPANGIAPGGLAACRASLAALSDGQLACVVGCDAMTHAIDWDAAAAVVGTDSAPTLAECIAVCTLPAPTPNVAGGRPDGALCSDFAKCEGECQIDSGTVGVCVPAGTGKVLPKL